MEPTTRSKARISALLTALLLGCAAMGSAHAQKGFSLSSPDLAKGSFDKKFILNGFGCKGENVSPALEWKNVPAGTKSLSLQIQDPDAPTGSGFWHWAVYNMPADTKGLAQGGLPADVQKNEKVIEASLGPGGH